MPTGLGDEKLWLCPTLDNVTPFNDLSGQANNGTAVGGLSTVADTSNGGAYCYDFDGTNDYIDGSLSTALGSSVSSSCWIKFDAAPTAIETFISNDGFATDGWLVQRLASSGGKLRYAEDANLNSFCDNSYPYSTSWRHIVSVRDGSTVRLYIDGVQLAVTNSSITGAIAKTAFNIGRRLDSASQYSACVMDDIRFYDRALTQSEITHLAEARGIEGPPPVGLGDEKLWLCPSINDSANDISGNGNDGVYQNGMGTVTDTAEGGSLAYDLAVNEDRIEISGIGSNWRSSGAWTISMWIKGMASQSNQHLVANGNVSLYRGSTSGERVQSQQLNPYSGTGYIATGVATSVWYHLTCTSDGTNMKMFANGVEFNSTAAGLATSNTGTMSFGSTAAQSPNGSPIVRLDDIRAYDRALTQAEITHLATSRGIEGSPSTSASLIASTSKGSTSGGVTTDAMDTTGADMICVNVSTYNKLGATVTDSEGNTWSALTVDINNTQRNGMFYCMNPATSSTHTFTYSEASSYPSVAVMAFSGVAAFDSEATSTQSGASTTILAGQVTPPTDDCLLIAAGSFEGGTISSVDSGFVLQEINPYLAYNYQGNMAAYLNQSTASTVNPEFTGTTSSLKSASVAVFTTSGTPPTAQYNAFTTHAFKQLFQTRLR